VSLFDRKTKSREPVRAVIAIGLERQATILFAQGGPLVADIEHNGTAETVDSFPNLPEKPGLYIWEGVWAWFDGECEYQGKFRSPSAEELTKIALGCWEPGPLKPYREPSINADDVYKHYKGGRYRIVGTARNSNNGPDDGKELVLYTCIDIDPLDFHDENSVERAEIVYARTVDEFFEYVPGYGDRFTLETT
jgi:hypothetical protein